MKWRTIIWYRVERDGPARSRSGKAIEPQWQSTLTSFQSYLNLGNLLRDQHRYADAIAAYRQCLALKPDYQDAFSNLLFCVNYDPDLSGEEIYGYYREYEDRFARSLYTEWKPYPHNRDPPSPVEDRLRLALLL